MNRLASEHTHAASAPAAVTVTLPYPPSANRYWRVVNGHPVVSAEAKAYKVAVAQRVARFRPMTGDVVLTVDVYRPAKRGDLDNTLKVLGDSLRGFAYADDRQVVEIHARRFEDKANPRAVVTVAPAADVAAAIEGRRNAKGEVR